MECPKNRGVMLTEHSLSQGLLAYRCPECDGNWLPTEQYKAWQAQQPPVNWDEVPKALDLSYEAAPLDSRASLCPDCGRYLSRVKVTPKSSFYVERCLSCEGIWCDAGEWELLERMGLAAVIDHLFSVAWQTTMREREFLVQERLATIDKLGDDLAEKVFELAALLKDHPNGDFGVAYLMRRFNP